jgi:hypothetical protein
MALSKVPCPTSFGVAVGEGDGVALGVGDAEGLGVALVVGVVAVLSVVPKNSGMAMMTRIAIRTAASSIHSQIGKNLRRRSRSSSLVPGDAAEGSSGGIVLISQRVVLKKR